ncbi:MAG: alpha/beta hydrolase family protein [Janthinobacterium lividum]
MLSFAGIFALLILLAPLSRADAPKNTAPLHGVDPAFYDYDQAAPFPVTEKPYGVENGVTITTVTYPSIVQTPYAVNNTVTAYLFMPPGPGPHPAMIVLHEWNAGSTRSGFLLARACTRAGVAALMVVEPYSLNRTPHPNNADDRRILSGNVPDMVAALRQAVMDARRGMDYLQKRPDIDPTRMGVSGISLGGVLSGIVAGVDPRVKVALTLVGGADFAKGFWDGLLTRPYRKQILNSGYTYETYQAAMAPVDAANWLPQRHFDPENVLMINGRYDLVILPDQAKALARDFGGTRIVWLDTGHYGAQFSASEASNLGVAFLRARFFGETANFHRPDGLPSRTIKLGVLLGGHEGLSPVIAVPVINFDGPGRYTIDGQLTLHGISAALSARIGLISSVGVEFPLLHGTTKPLPFVMFSLTL